MWTGYHIPASSGLGLKDINRIVNLSTAALEQREHNWNTGLLDIIIIFVRVVVGGTFMVMDYKIIIVVYW